MMVIITKANIYSALIMGVSGTVLNILRIDIITAFPLVLESQLV